MHRTFALFMLIGMLFISVPHDSIHAQSTRTPTQESASLSPQTLVALSSTDYVTVGLALFSAQSQADIDALDGLFQRLLKRELLQSNARAAVRPPTLSQRITMTITGATTYSRMLPASMLKTLKRGDILLRRSSHSGCTTTQSIPGCRSWAAVYDHAALYYGMIKGVPMIYESIPQRGVQLVPLRTWQQKKGYVGVYRPKVPLPNQSRALTPFVQTYGNNGRTQFNPTQTDKATDSSVSSAQLVWLYYQTLGIDVDSNNDLYAHWIATGYSPLVASYIARHAIAPDEIALSPVLTCVAHGWLP